MTPHGSTAPLRCCAGAWRCCWRCARCAAQDVLPVPPLSGARHRPDRHARRARSARRSRPSWPPSRREAGTQIVVLMVPTTQPEDIAAYAQRVGDTWKIGRRDVGDGLLIVVAKNDRRVRIEVAKALEGAVPDLAARQIIDRADQPGLPRRRLRRRPRRRRRPAHRRASRARTCRRRRATRGEARDGGSQWEELAMFFFIGVPIARRRAERRAGPQAGQRWPPAAGPARSAGGSARA